MFNFKKSTLLVMAMLSSTAYSHPTDDLQELLSANPVSQSELAALDGMISSVGKQDEHNLDVKPTVSLSQKNVLNLDDKKIAVENEIAKTLSKEKVALKTVSGLNLFVSNIPAGSTFKFKKTLMLTTNGTAMFFKDGQRIYENPFIKDKFATFCMFRFAPATTGRRIMQDKSFVIDSVGYKALDKKMGLSADKHIQILKLDIKNKDFKQVVCYSGAMTKPMTTGDLTQIIGNGFSMGIEQYRDI
ncbi:hypothetical protein [Photobacterium damselae]|uniref:hypothetical protein n=1 Tax=Photobacterium damselae TaxID=38293 RepID=UPI001F2A5847|nr:hypothetical protein [Photobacterium damselae]UKA04589.1 hypothetical protein IHC89_23510 [Photobacterium damselae subsp. damselae]